MSDVPGSIYLNGNRYWWDVRLPGKNRRTKMPLRPPGARYATRDKAVAEQLAREAWHRAVFAADHLRPDLVVCLGDLLDCSQFSRHPPTHGHTHRADASIVQNVWSPGRVVQARSAGCLSKTIPLYGTGRPVEWVNAFILGYLGRRSDTLYTIPIMGNRCILPDGTEVRA